MISIYLAGKIKKAHEEANESYWGVEEIALLKRTFNQPITLLDPAIRSDDLSDQKSVFGRDVLMVTCADVVFVDARDRRGLGVGAEMMLAKMNRTPVVTLAPKGSHYHKSKTTTLGVEIENWVHPFIENLSDQVVETIEAGVKWILDLPSEIKGPEWIAEAIAHYKQSQLPKDEPMQAILNTCPNLLF